MVTNAAALPDKKALLPLLAVLSLGLGILAAWRIDASERLDLLTLAAGALAFGITVAQFFASRHRTWAGIAVVAAAIVALEQSALGIDPQVSDAAVWALLSVGIVCWSQDHARLARSTMISCASLTLGLPLLLAQTENSLRDTAPLVLAAMCASVAFGTVLDRIVSVATGFTSRSLRIWSSEIPSLGLWFAAGSFSVAACTSRDQAWEALTLFAVGAVFVVESLTPPARHGRVLNALPDGTVLLVALVAIMSASGLSVASIAAGTPFGWPVAGVSVAAVLSLAVVGNDSLRTSAQQVERLKRSARESRVDALTGISNRRGLDERLGDEIARAVRFGHPLALLMIDIDDFKQINDRFGHATGDEVLKSLASLIEQSVRSIDIAARYGGEEFVVLLPETDLNGATVVADRIRSGMIEQSAPVSATVSVGVAVMSEFDPSPSSLLAQADEALYRAKGLGKNRVVLAR